MGSTPARGIDQRIRGAPDPGWGRDGARLRLQPDPILANTFHLGGHMGTRGVAERCEPPTGDASSLSTVRAAATFPPNGHPGVPLPGRVAEGSNAADKCEQLPGTLHTLQRLWSTVVQGDVRAHDQVPYRPGGKDLTRSSRRHHAGRDVHGDARRHRGRAARPHRCAAQPGSRPRGHAARTSAGRPPGWRAWWSRRCR
jgi:hypothetical protein